MARIRSIKPEFPHSESMGRVSRDARLTFIELWTLADDSGRLRGNSRMLASLLFPYDDDAKDLIEGWLDELEREDCIARYMVDGTSYVQICKWLTHQKIDKPTPSKLPEFKEESRGFARIREGSSGDWKGREGIGEDGKGSPSASATPTRKPVPRESPPEAGWFLEFKLAYPNRAGDQGWRKAQRAANARLAEGHTEAEFVAGARRYAVFCEATGKTGLEFVKQACTFLGPDKHFLSPWHPPPKVENATERILRHLNGTENSRVIEHEPDEQAFLPSY